MGRAEANDTPKHKHSIENRLSGGWQDGLVHKVLPHKHEDVSLDPEHLY